MFKEPRQYRVLAGLCFGIMGLTAVGYFVDRFLFRRFLGSENPLAVVLFILVLAWFLLSFLLSRGGFAIYKRENLKDLVRWSGLAVVFALVAVFVDWRAVLPPDMNVAFPGSLAFYPVMGFIVEIVFHALPLSLILLIWILFFRDRSPSPVVWVIGIFIIALGEPILQVGLGYSRRVPSWVLVWTALQVYFINLAELFIFRRRGFLSMYSFRLVYYLLWHIIWGSVRLRVFFG